MRARFVVVFAVLAVGAAAAAVAGARVEAGLPACATHDPTVWHGLVDEARRCHYDHEHKDDPHAVDDVLGPPGAWFGGGEISYPWQTFKGAGERWPRRPAAAGLLENDFKHEGYGYGVRRGMRCRPAFDADGCLTDIRMQVHALATVHDATTRFHSFSLEARGCIRGRCGIVREGGWIDYGELRLDTGKPYAIEHLPLPGDPVGQDQLNPQRIHKSPPNEQRDATWYSQPGRWNRHLSNLGLRFEMWGPVDPRDPSRVTTYCTVDARGRPRPGCTANGSWLETHLVPVRVPAELDGRDGKRDGLVTFRGFTDRYGNLRSGCRRAGLDCVPLQLEHMPVGYYQYRDDVQGVTAADHDVTPPGRSWLCFPRGVPA